MKKDGKYRFTLQFPADTEEQIAVGELLERMGNRKSALVVDAVLRHIRSQPDPSKQELFSAKSLSFPVSRKALLDLVREVLSETAPSQSLSSKIPIKENDPADPKANTDSGLETMLNNLTLFQ